MDAVTVSPYGAVPSPAGTSAAALGGPGPALLSGVSLRFGLGQGYLGQPLGELAFWTDLPTNTMWSPESLFVLALTNAMVVTNGDGSPRQIYDAQCLVDITSVSYGYQLAFYPSLNLTPPPNYQTALATSGLTPFVTWTVDNPDGANGTNRLRVTEARGGQSIVSIFTWDGTATWTLSAGNASRQQTFCKVWDPYHTHRTETFTTAPVGGAVQAQSVAQVQVWDLCEHPAIEVDGAGTVSQTTRRGFAPGADPETWRGNVLQATNGLGYFVTYQYADDGRVASVQRDFGHGNPSTLDFEYSEDPGISSDCGVSTLSDDPTYWPLRPRVVNQDGEPVFLFFAQANTCYEVTVTDDAHDSLVTKRTFYPATDVNATRLKSVQYPDGTVEMYSYSGSASSFTITRLAGVPNGSGGLTRGTETITVLGALGQLVSQQVYDIAPEHTGGVLTASDTYTYLDSLDLSYLVTHLDNTSESYYWSNAAPGLSASIDRDGATTSTSYDPLWRLTATTRSDFGNTVSNVLDAVGHTLAVVRYGGGSSMTTWTAGYDVVGRLTAMTNALGGPSTLAYALDSRDGNTLVTTTLPDGGTRVEDRNHDGTLYRLTGTAVAGLQYHLTPTDCKVTHLDASGDTTEEFEDHQLDLQARPIAFVNCHGTWRTLTIRSASPGSGPIPRMLPRSRLTTLSANPSIP